MPCSERLLGGKTSSIAFVIVTVAQMCCRVVFLPIYAIILQMPKYGHPPGTGNGDDWGGFRMMSVPVGQIAQEGEAACSALMCLTVKSPFLDLFQTSPLGGIIS